jgi:hypothetical protein
MKLVDPFPKGHISLYTQFRTKHVPLNIHLHRIGKSPTHCPHCPERDETIHHFLFECPRFNLERHQLANALRRQATDLRFLLTEDVAYKPLMRYIKNTGRFNDTFGEITIV